MYPLHWIGLGWTPHENDTITFIDKQTNRSGSF
jgi:hypothetical protein